MEPRISLLSGESGRTFAHTGMVVMRESRAFFERVISNIPKPESRDFEAVLAWRHEIIHFIQSISTAYLYNHSVAMLKFAFNVLDNFQGYVAAQDKITEFENTAKLLSYREYGISVRDLLEGVAVIESFKMSVREPDLMGFLKFRDDFFPGDGDSCYRKSFDNLSEKAGQLAAYRLLAPLSFVALQSDEPQKSFRVITEEILPRTSPDLLVNFSVPMLFSSLGMNISDHLLYNLDSVPVKMRHPILYECAKYAARSIGISNFLEMAACPSIIESSGTCDESVDALLPPLVTFSSSPGAKLEGVTYGLAKRDKELAQLIVDTTGLVGAAERLTIFRHNSELYQFCPHATRCPHYASALCFDYFAPPSIELGYEKCAFIRFFENRTKVKPNEAWVSLNSR